MKPQTLSLAAPLIALALVPIPAQAAKAPPETVLHIDASATVPPDQAKVTITLIGKGPNEAEAKADLAARQKEFGEQLGQMGLGSAAFEHGAILPDSSSIEVEIAYDEGDAAMAAADAATAAAAAAAPAGAGKRKAAAQRPPKPIRVAAPTTVTITDLSKLDGLRALGELNGTRSYQFQRGVRFVASNPDAARKKARDAAIAKAKREADDYAASLGYKVVRMTRISNSSPPIAMGDIYGLFGMIDTMPERFMPSYYGAVTSVSVSIDFAIMPN